MGTVGHTWLEINCSRYPGVGHFCASKPNAAQGLFKSHARHFKILLFLNVAFARTAPHSSASEVRPHTGEVACVAEFTIAEPLRAIDLRNPRKLVSPFLLEDAAEIGKLRADIPFLERLGEELTRPVLPSGAAIDYIPSQYLCEFIKKCGYDGVVYRSSVSEGINLALFDPAKATGGAVLQYNIRRVSVDVEPRHP